jgi:hypothetical protein
VKNDVELSSSSSSSLPPDPPLPVGVQAKLHSAIELDQIIVLEAGILKYELGQEEQQPRFCAILDSIVKHAMQNAGLIQAVRKELVGDQAAQFVGGEELLLCQFR